MWLISKVTTNLIERNPVKFNSCGVVKKFRFETAKVFDISPKACYYYEITGRHEGFAIVVAAVWS